MSKQIHNGGETRIAVQCLIETFEFSLQLPVGGVLVPGASVLRQATQGVALVVQRQRRGAGDGGRFPGRFAEGIVVVGGADLADFGAGEQGRDGVVLQGQCVRAGEKSLILK